MENQVITLSGEKYKSLGFTDKRLYLSQKNEKDFAALEKTGQNVGITSEGIYVLLEKLESIHLNTGDTDIKVKYLDYSKKKKSLTFKFDRVEKSLAFAELLGNKLTLKKEVTQEKQWLPLLKNVGWLTLTVGLTYFMVGMEDGSEMDSSGSRKSRGGAAILRIIYNLVGPTGILIIGSLISLAIIWATYNRFKKPEQDIVFTR